MAKKQLKEDSPESEDRRSLMIEEDVSEEDLVNNDPSAEEESENDDKSPRTLYHGGISSASECSVCGGETCSSSGLMGDCSMPGITVGEDPVSGNPVPAGSSPKEVRDDIPALLSEGEYVIPADVVRYHGLKTFESLRMEAKLGLMDMAFEGQIQSYDPEAEDEDEETHTMPDGTEMDGATHEDYVENEDVDVEPATIETMTETMDDEDVETTKQARDLSYRPKVTLAYIK